MNEQALETHISEPHQEDAFTLISELERNPNLTQRELSARMDVSFGKINYLLNSLVKKGILKVKNFSQHGGKVGKVKYLLTPRGIEAKVRLTWKFLKKKEIEYEKLKLEWAKLKRETL